MVLRSLGEASFEPLFDELKGFRGQRLSQACGLMGLMKASLGKVVRTAAETVDRSSRWLWIRKSEPWNPSTTF